MLFKSAYLGDKEVVKAYKGDTLFYKAGLPSGYTSLNYLQGQGSQWIDTGVIAERTQTELQFSVTGSISGNEIVCAGYGYNDNRYIPLSFASGYFHSFLPNNTSVQLGTPTQIGTSKHTLIYNDDNHRILLDNVNKGTTWDLSASSERMTVGLFAYHGGTISGYCSHIRIYSCVFTDKSTGKEIWHGVPSLDKNNRPCMFDMVSRQPFYNAGTGEFLYG